MKNATDIVKEFNVYFINTGKHLAEKKSVKYLLKPPIRDSIVLLPTDGSKVTKTVGDL